MNTGRWMMEKPGERCSQVRSVSARSRMTELKRQRCRALLQERGKIADAGTEREPDRIRIDRELCLMGIKMPRSRPKQCGT